jgi:hypothetical protein
LPSFCDLDCSAASANHRYQKTLGYSAGHKCFGKRWITDRRAVNLVRPFEKAKLSGIYTAMGRPLGAKNKRTLLREANIREAAARAQFDLAITADESIKADSLAVMEDAMAYFNRLALKERHRSGDADPKAIRDNLREAVTIAKEVAPYRHARLSSVKVGTDRANAP